MIDPFPAGMAKNCDLYTGKVALAPMVRAGRTPLRVLSLDYGADIAYTEEIIDQKLLNCTRTVNDSLGCVDYTIDDELILRIASEEKSRCILQIGTNSAENAVKICKKFGGNVAAIDVNMGCPKPFSVHCGMGSALLSKPLLAKEILSSMTAVSSVPISCKIRVLQSREETLEFGKMVEECGVSALAVHGRQKDERPQNLNRTDEIRDISRALSIPVLANGGSSNIKTYDDIQRFMESAGASGVLLARVALSHPSIFRKEGVLSMEQEIFNFLEKSCRYDENYTASKYMVQRILGSQQEFHSQGKATVLAGTSREICNIWGHNASPHCRWSLDNPTKSTRDEFVRVVDGVQIADVSFAPKHLRQSNNGRATPKCVLRAYCLERRLPLPEFELKKKQDTGRFTAIITVKKNRYSSSVSQPNRRMAEQVAALVALHCLDLRYRLEGDWESR